MPERMVDVGSAFIFPSDIVAIEKGKWSDQSQDWTAILVSDGGARIQTELLVKYARDILEHSRLAQKEG